MKAQTFEWAKQLGGTNSDQSVAISTDASGNIYTTGYFMNTVDFDPGPGVFNLSSAGGFDIYISKLDAAGNFVWAKKIGASSNDQGLSIATDANGNVYATGYFQNTVDFNPGIGAANLSSVGSYDIFILKLDAAGNFVWAKRLGGSGTDYSYSISTDVLGNVYTTGHFRNTADFDPGASTFNLTSVGIRDIFICKLDATGNFKWAKQIGGSGFDNGFSVSTDANGNVYSTGTFRDTVDFDPGLGTFNLISTGGSDIYISKLDAAGNFKWAKQMGGLNNDAGISITSSISGDVYTTGYFYGTIDFNPGVGTFLLSAAGSRDVFISKLDSTGTFLWAKRLGGTSDNRGYSILTDTSDNVYTTGFFKNTADFDPGSATFNLSSLGNSDVFISKLNSFGNFIWAKQMGGVDDEYGTALDKDASGNIYTTGYFENTVDFDTDTSVFNLTSNGSSDAFIHKLSQCAVARRTEIISACNSYTWLDGNIYTTSTNSPTFVIAGGAANGCDSIVSLNLTINTSSTGTDFITACNSFTWIDGISYTTSTNAPTFNFIGCAANGCDSIVSLNLTINNSSTGTDFITACNSFTWVDGISYTTSTNAPTFNFIGGAANGCDSLLGLNLTINTVSDISTITNGTILSANLIATSYQWLDCDASYAIIPGETNQLFTTNANGSYAVELGENGCLDTSLCVTINTVSTFEDAFLGQRYTVYPNPTAGQCSINLGANYAKVRLVVRNVIGQEISRKSYRSPNRIDLIIEGSPGVYFIEIFNGEQSRVQKIIKR